MELKYKVALVGKYEKTSLYTGLQYQSLLVSWKLRLNLWYFSLIPTVYYLKLRATEYEQYFLLKRLTLDTTLIRFYLNFSSLSLIMIGESTNKAIKFGMAIKALSTSAKIKTVLK